MCTLRSLALVKKSCDNINNSRTHKFPDYVISFDYGAMYIKCFQRKSKETKYWYKILLLKHILRFAIRKNCICKLSIKIFVKSQSSKDLHLLNISEFLDVGKIFFELHTRQLCLTIFCRTLSDVRR